MAELTNKDFFIVKLQNYADRYLLNKWRNNGSTGPFPQQHYDRARIHSEFFWKLVEHVTGKDMHYWYINYMIYTIECAQDEMHELTGLRRLEGEGWYTYYIPKTNPELYEWFMINNPCPFKILKRGKMFWLNRWASEVNTTRRIEERNRTIQFRLKHGIEESN